MAKKESVGIQKIEKFLRAGTVDALEKVFSKKIGQAVFAFTSIALGPPPLKFAVSRIVFHELSHIAVASFQKGEVNGVSIKVDKLFLRGNTKVSNISPVETKRISVSGISTDIGFDVAYWAINGSNVVGIGLIAFDILSFTSGSDFRYYRLSKKFSQQ